jgi:hypothetical protein
MEFCLSVCPTSGFEWDCLRPISTIGNWLDTPGRTKPTQGTLYDCGAYTVTNDGQTFWGQRRFRRDQVLFLFRPCPELQQQSRWRRIHRCARLVLHASFISTDHARGAFVRVACFRGQHRERCFMAAKCVGKSVVGVYETTVHLTRDYPPWWEGRRFGRLVIPPRRRELRRVGTDRRRDRSDRSHAPLALKWTQTALPFS